MDLILLVSIVSTILETITIFRFFSIFSRNIITSRKVVHLSYIGYFIINICIFGLAPIPLLIMSSSIITLYLLSLNYEMDLKKRAFTVMIIYMTSMFIETLFAVIAGIYHMIPINMVVPEYESILGVIMLRMTNYSIINSLSKYNNINKNIKLPNLYWCAFIITPLLSLILLIIILSSQRSNLNIFIGLVCLMFINSGLIYLFDSLTETIVKLYEDKMEIQKIKLIKQESKIMQDSANEFKKQRHDLKNHMLSILGLLNTSEFDSAKAYIEEIYNISLPDCTHVSTGNYVLDSLISYKLQIMYNNLVKVECEIKIPENLKIPFYEFSIILGNLFDNAIEAVDKIENKYIQFVMKYDRGRIFISMKNSFNGELTSSNGVLLTTKKDREKHGVGIRNIINTLEKMDGEFKFTIKDGLFISTCIIYM